MCAINGFTFEDENLIQKMNQVTNHRGPDGSGVFTDGAISLGHNRLAIIDLSPEANQPMRSAGDLEIVFNGEIYNFKELRKELSSYSFKTKSDTEVILAAYEKWGTGAFDKLNGIFALAIWDKNKLELILARDHIGVKPLYYFYEKDRLIFSSEIKAILEHNISRNIDSEALAHYFRLLYTPEPFTLFKDIKKFPAASFGVFKNGTFSIKQFWKRNPTENSSAVSESEEYEF